MERGLLTCHTLYSPSRLCLYCISLYKPFVFQAFPSPDHQSSYPGSPLLPAQLAIISFPLWLSQSSPSRGDPSGSKPCLASWSSWAGHQLALGPCGGFPSLAPILTIHPIAVPSWPQHCHPNIHSMKIFGKIPQAASFTTLQIFAGASGVLTGLLPSRGGFRARLGQPNMEGLHWDPCRNRGQGGRLTLLCHKQEIFWKMLSQGNQNC